MQHFKSKIPQGCFPIKLYIECLVYSSSLPPPPLALDVFYLFSRRGQGWESKICSKWLHWRKQSKNISKPSDISYGGWCLVLGSGSRCDSVDRTTNEPMIILCTLPRSHCPAILKNKQVIYKQNDLQTGTIQILCFPTRQKADYQCTDVL